MKRVKNGFTLVEMLVVISIIGILAAVALVSFTPAQRQARDTTRKSDLKQYQNALETYANITSGMYPSRITAASASTTLCTDLNAKITPDMSCPEDARNATDATFAYKYISDGTGTGAVNATSYVLWAKIENSSATRYFVVCSSGRNGESAQAPASSTCPL